MSLLRQMFSLNLRLKFILPVSTLLIVSTLVISGYLITSQSDSYHHELISRGETMIKILAINAESGVLFESTYELDDLLAILRHFGDVEYAEITNLEEQVLSQNGKQIAIDRERTAELGKDRCHGSEDVPHTHVIDQKGRELLIMRTPITTQKRLLNREMLGITGGVDQTLSSSRELETIGSIMLVLSVENVNKAIADAKMAAILVTLLVVIATIIIIAFIVNVTAKPITELVAITDRISRGDLSTKVEVNQQDEIGQLGVTFNRMIDSLKESRDEIEQYNRTLEEKIIERTQQLEETQEQLVQSEKMSAIGQLAAGVAHELNNPLGGILGYAQFTLEKLRKLIPEKTTPKEIQSFTRYISDIETQARRCKTIVQNLLRFSRSSHSVDFDDDVDVNQVLEETITFVAHQLKINQIELEVVLTESIPPISGNSGQLQQVFTNLIINAMHASDPDSIITVKSRFSPALGEFDGTVEISISDTGYGISEENLKKIFEPFFTTKEVGKGTGLGLSVSYGIIKEHGGEITVNSAVNEGTTFTIVLPVQKAKLPTDTIDETEVNHL